MKGFCQKPGIFASQFSFCDIDTVFPQIVSAETILFLELECAKYSYFLEAETIQGRKVSIDLYLTKMSIFTYLINQQPFSSLFGKTNQWFDMLAKFSSYSFRGNSSRVETINY